MAAQQTHGMWDIGDLPEIGQLPGPDQLWIIASAVEDNGGPANYIQALRGVAERLEEIGWWISESALPEAVREPDRE